jgi:choline kinase
LKAIILAAGMGTRLGSLTKKIPKCMLKIFNQTLIERHVEILRNCGINDIIIVTGHQNEVIDLSNVTYVKNENFKTTNINESLFCALKEWDCSVLVLYSDIIFEQKIISDILESREGIRLAVSLNWKNRYDDRKMHPLSEAENVLIENNSIVQIQKNISKSTLDQQIGEFLGIMLISQEHVKIMLKKYAHLKKTHTGTFHKSQSLSNAYATDMLQELINSEIKITPVITEDKWREIDTVEDLEIAKKLFYQK